MAEPDSLAIRDANGECRHKFAGESKLSGVHGGSMPGPPLPADGRKHNRRWPRLFSSLTLNGLKDVPGFS